MLLEADILEKIIVLIHKESGGIYSSQTIRNTHTRPLTSYIAKIFMFSIIILKSGVDLGVDHFYISTKLFEKICLWKCSIFIKVAGCRLKLNFFTDTFQRLGSYDQLFRSSSPEVFSKKGVPKIFVKLTGKRMCQSLFLNKPAALRLLYMCFPVSLVKF